MEFEVLTVTIYIGNWLPRHHQSMAVFTLAALSAQKMAILFAVALAFAGALVERLRHGFDLSLADATYMVFVLQRPLIQLKDALFLAPEHKLLPRVLLTLFYPIVRGTAPAFLVVEVGLQLDLLILFFLLLLLTLLHFLIHEIF